MHRETETARWYRRVDSSCFTTQHPSDTGHEGQPRFVAELPDAAIRAEPSPAASATWLGGLAQRLSATRAWHMHPPS